MKKIANYVKTVILEHFKIALSNLKKENNEDFNFLNWVEIEEENDPYHFSWLFDDEEISDFGSSLSNEEKQIAKDFYNSLNIVKLDYENYKKVSNCYVIDDNFNLLKIEGKKDTLVLTSDDKQESCTFIEFDNNTTITYDSHSCFYVSELSLEEEIEFYLDAVENKENCTVWGNDIIFQLVAKFSNLSDKIKKNMFYVK